MKKNIFSRTVVISFLCFVLLGSGCQFQKASCTVQEPWKFVVTGDSRGGDNGVNTAVLKELAAEIANINPEFVLFPGDLVNGYNSQEELESQLKTWRQAMTPIYDAGIKVYAVRGNHDLGKPKAREAWNNLFEYLPDNGPEDETNVTYAVTHQNALIIGLDQYVNSKKINIPWVDAQFETNTQPHIFVFGHEPAFKAQHGDCLGSFPESRNALLKSIEKAGGRTYFCGHDHFYAHASADNDGDPENDIHQFLVGTAGAPLRDWVPLYDGDNGGYKIESIKYTKQYGYVLVVVDGLDVTMTWMERVGKDKYEPVEVWRYKAASVPAK